MTNVEDKRAHLNMIQAVISRMANNSFLFKGWAVTITAGVAALASNKSDHRFVFIALLPSLVMWPLNGYFLYQERRFRKLFDHVRTLADNKIDYSMKPLGRKFLYKEWLACTLSKTLVWFYGVQLAFVIVSIIMVC